MKSKTKDKCLYYVKFCRSKEYKKEWWKNANKIWKEKRMTNDKLNAIDEMLNLQMLQVKWGSELLQKALELETETWYEELKDKQDKETA